MNNVWFYNGMEEIYNGCKKNEITSIVVQDGITYIPKKEFQEMEQLESVTLPKNNSTTLVRIEAYAFHACRKLKSIHLPSSSLQEIGDNAFLGCISLKSIHLPSSLQKLGTGVFWDCHSLQSITIPSSLTKIEAYTFVGCKSLTNINLSSSSNNIQSIDKGAFYGCVSLSSIYLPSSVTIIESDSFAKCTNLKSIHLPSSIQHIGQFAFSKCTSLVSINIPPSLLTVGKGSFQNCTSLESIHIQSNVKDIIRHSTSTHNCAMTLLRDIIKINPRVAQSPCTNDSIMPLHLLLMFGYVQRRDSTYDLVMAAPFTLSIRDPIYKFYPFLLAACTPRIESFEKNRKGYVEVEHIETIYILLRNAPCILNILVSKLINVK